MDRSRAALATLALVAVTTSFLAGWGLVGSSQASRAGPSTAYTSTSYAPAGNGSYGATTTTTAESTSTSPASGSSTSATAQSTATVTATETTTTAANGGVTYGFGPGITTTASNGALGSISAWGSWSPGESGLREAQSISLLLAPVAWVVLGGAWVWRGRVRTRYTELGFGSDVFELFMKMKGGATRIKVLDTLSTPKDRLQLAEELGVDWKTVDRHVQILNRYGFVRERAAFGTVRLYEVTPMGKMLLDLFDDLERTDGQVLHGSAVSRSREAGHADP